MSFLKNLFQGQSLGKFQSLVLEINKLESEIEKLKDEDFKKETADLKESLKNGKALGDIIPRAFALVREAAKRTLGQRPYDVQLIGGLVLHQGAVSEMMTGEGKTLAAVAPAYLNALTEEGVHVVTVNEYLARRDAVWMGQIYRLLGLSVACLVPNNAYLYDPDFKVPEDGQELIDKERDTTGSFLVQKEFLRPISRREAYLAHITYGTNHEFGFDYLRDNLSYSLETQVQRSHPFAIIDEVDSILIDEARTPLIIAAPDEESNDFYRTFSRVASRLQNDLDYIVDEKHRSVAITDPGIEKVEKMLGVKNIYASQNLRLVHYLEESLRAHAIFKRDKDYVVKNGEVIIVDEFTGRLLQGRRYNGGLHQAIEAKEGVQVKEESRTYAKISVQNYFRLYKKISGMTGTAQTSAEEFHKVYNLEVVSIPPNRPLVRKDFPDAIYRTEAAKWQAIAAEIKEHYQRGQPVLVGTTSIEKNEILAALLSRENIPHEVLNAKNNEREGAIIAQAGHNQAITVATNMAGRGVDIILGGNPPNPEETQKIRTLGGLHIIGTERHEARRIDNQLRGRAGRQGDPGSSQFFLSLEDDLVRVFGGERVKNLMEKFNLPDDVPIQVGIVSKAVAQAQSRVEGANFDLRKHLLEYDDILNKQRANVYKRRQEFLESLSREKLANYIFESSANHLEKIFNLPDSDSLDEETPTLSKEEKIKNLFKESGLATSDHPYPENPDLDNLKSLITKRSFEISVDPMSPSKLLGILDMLWMTNLENLEALNESIGLRAYGQKDPLVEFKQESRVLFQDFWNNFDSFVFMNLFRSQLGSQNQHQHNNSALPSGQTPVASGAKVGRNDPCPCGSGKKYKKCGLINAPEHKK
ncbi:MAG: preprotein translocase subunit SecA [Candidatus Liptonbacteria bacterium]|nr:preprotein translocase subunit SecA [Candidatus Liptonbacteria bacterium]